MTLELKQGFGGVKLQANVWRTLKIWQSGQFFFNANMHI